MTWLAHLGPVSDGWLRWAEWPGPQGWLRVGVILVFGSLITVRPQGVPEYDLAPIHYSTTEPTNRVSILQQRLEEDPGFHGLDPKTTLRRCLEALEVPVDSQVLVFSKTSLQRNRISPRTPRAVYFSDDCYVGWVPGGLVEVAVSDPKLGLVFYSFDPTATPGDRRFVRDEDCLSCHAGPLTRRWPALMVRSVFVDARGEPISHGGSFLTGHDSPLSERWGGWYVTGQHGREHHMGNATAREMDREVVLDRVAGANATDLSKYFRADEHLRSDSDIVALMVFEHQVGMHNRLVEGGLRTRKWMHYQQALQRELGEPISPEPTGTALRVIESEASRIVEHLLFVGEARLPDGGIQGNDAFPTAFRQNRRTDGQGRSLKDLELRTRLFRFRCSHLIYSEAFESLPLELKRTVYRRLDGILGADTPPAPFQHLGDDERQAIREILVATKSDLATEWNGSR